MFWDLRRRGHVLTAFVRFGSADSLGVLDGASVFQIRGNSRRTKRVATGGVGETDQAQGARNAGCGNRAGNESAFWQYAVVIVLLQSL